MAKGIFQGIEKLCVINFYTLYLLILKKYNQQNLNVMIISNAVSFYFKRYCARYFVNKLLVDGTQNIFQGKELINAV